MKKQTLLLSTLCLTIGLSGCTTTHPYTGEEKTSNTVKAGAAGAAAGALIGMLASSKNDRRKGALIGAAAGAALGGGAGYYMDQQEAKLRDQLNSTGVSISRHGNDIILNMPNSITFDTNSSQLKASGVHTLSGVALVLKEYQDTAVQIVGHTDSSGGRDLNMRLSLQRADSVATSLIHQGVDGGRMSTYGVGPDQPMASNDTADGKAQNRRVTITLSPLS